MPWGLPLRSVLCGMNGAERRESPWRPHTPRPGACWSRSTQEMWEGTEPPSEPRWESSRGRGLEGSWPHPRGLGWVVWLMWAPVHEARKTMSALSRQDGSGLPFCCYCCKTLGMILNYFPNKKQVNSKLTQHGGVGDGKRWCINNNFIINWKGQFSFQSQRKAVPKNAQTTAQLHSSHTLVK